MKPEKTDIHAQRSQIHLLIFANRTRLLLSLLQGFSPALPMGLALTKVGMLARWSTSLLRQGARVPNKNVSFSSPVQGSGKMTLSGGLRTLLGGLSSMRGCSRSGPMPVGYAFQEGDALPQSRPRDLKELLSSAPTEFGNMEALLVEKFIACLLAEDEARVGEIPEEEVDNGLDVSIIMELHKMT